MVLATPPDLRDRAIGEVTRSAKRRRVRADREDASARRDDVFAFALRSRVENERAVRRRDVEALDAVSDLRRRRVTLRRHDDGERGSGLRREASFDLTARRAVQQREPVAVEQRYEHGRLGIAEAHVELEDA